MFWKNKNKEDSGQKMEMLQRLAMKKLMSMSPQEQEEMMRKVLSPDNIARNKDKILKAMEQMKVSGQMTDEQIKMAKERLGL